MGAWFVYPPLGFYLIANHEESGFEYGFNKRSVCILKGKREEGVEALNFLWWADPSGFLYNDKVHNDGVLAE